jgi:hypothetical protein
MPTLSKMRWASHSYIDARFSWIENQQTRSERAMKYDDPEPTENVLILIVILVIGIPAVLYAWFG